MYGWSSNAASSLGCAQSDDLQRLILVSVDVGSGRERVLNGACANAPSQLADQGFFADSDKSFATSLVRVRSDLWLIDDFTERNAFNRLKALFWR